jgi:NitT/TauT family transport system substrate-binding protein
MRILQSRRRFLTNLGYGGAASLVGAGLAGIGGRWNSLAAEPPPETLKLRLSERPPTCLAPQVVVRDLLLSEGFTDIEYVTWGRQSRTWVPDILLSGEVDITVSFIPPDLLHIDAGDPIVWLAGSHLGCVELIAGDRVSSIRDLKGKTVAVTFPRSADDIFVSMFAAYVGLDPRKDIHWVFVAEDRERMRQLAAGDIDAFVTSPPLTYEIREKKIGHVLVNTTADKPWSQYFCCMITSTTDFIRRHPVATKRALRALLKATDLCASEPERAARLIADRQVPPFYNWRYDNILKGLQEIPYGRWREYDPEDALRFYALWMREVGIIKNSPQKIIAEGADWRFLNELKRELKI